MPGLVTKGYYWVVDLLPPKFYRSEYRAPNFPT